MDWTGPTDWPCSSSSSSTTPTQQRSTRGASKARRDLINVEIQRLRELLPLADSVRDRLFQLQVMSLVCVYIRKHVYLARLVGRREMEEQSRRKCPLSAADVSRAMRAFVFAATASGRVVLVSDNAAQWLGQSVEEMVCQGDSLYDLVDPRDHAKVQRELSSRSPGVFLCRINASSRPLSSKRQLQLHNFVLVHGHFADGLSSATSGGSSSSTTTTDEDEPLFVAWCRPLLHPENTEHTSSDAAVFCASLAADLAVLRADAQLADYYWRQERDGAPLTLYELVHPEDLPRLAKKHAQLCSEEEGGVVVLLRLLLRGENGGSDGKEEKENANFQWAHVVLALRSSTTSAKSATTTADVPAIHATFQLLTEEEKCAVTQCAWLYDVRNAYPAAVALEAANHQQNGMKTGVEEVDYSISNAADQADDNVSPRSSSSSSASSSTNRKRKPPSNDEVEPLPELDHVHLEQFFKEVESSSTSSAAPSSALSVTSDASSSSSSASSSSASSSSSLSSAATAVFYNNDPMAAAVFNHQQHGGNLLIARHHQHQHYLGPFFATM